MNSQPKNAKYRPEPIVEALLTMMSVISAVAGFERDLLLERTHSRVKTAGERFGRPSALNEEQQFSVITRISAGVSISAISREFNTTQ